MLLLIGPILLALLVWLAIKAKRAGLSGWEVALMIAVGLIVIVVVLFGILAWGFRGFA